MNVKQTVSSINEEFIKKGASSINSEDVRKVLDRANEITQKVVKSEPLQRFLRDVALLISMVRDYRSGAYREIPWWVIAAVVFTLLYVLSPIDLIPDVIPVIGLVDDALVLALCLAMIEQDLIKYQEWKESEINEAPAQEGMTS